MSMTASRRGRRKTPEGPRASLTQLLPFLFEHKRVLVVVVLLSVFGAAATLLQPLVVGKVITLVQAGAQGQGQLTPYVWALVALVVVSSVLSGYQHYLLQRTGTAVVFSSRRKLISRILHLPIAEFDARRTGDLVSRVGTDTTLLYAVMTQGLVDAVGNALIFLGAIIAMAIIDPVLLGIIVLVLAIAAAAVVALSGRIRVATREQQEKVGELASGVERAVGSIRTVRASGATGREEESVTGLAEETYRIGVRIAKVSALVVPVAGIALQVSLLVVLGVGGLRVAAGAITIASLVTFIMFLFMLVAPLGSFFGAITSVNQALGALGRIQEVLDLPSETTDDAAIAAAVLGARERATSRPEAAQDAAPTAIEFRDVHFRYPAAVVAARAKAESEAATLLESAHVALPASDLPETTCCAESPSPCRTAHASRSSGPRGPASRRPSRSWSGSTTRPAARSSWTAPMCARSIATTCAPGSGTSNRMRRPSRARSPTTCGWPPPTHPTRRASSCCAR
jgi:ATP-binding cassette subfamily B protein